MRRSAVLRRGTRIVWRRRIAGVPPEPSRARQGAVLDDNGTASLRARLGKSAICAKHYTMSPVAIVIRSMFPFLFMPDSFDFGEPQVLVIATISNHG